MGGATDQCLGITVRKKKGFAHFDGPPGTHVRRPYFPKGGLGKEWYRGLCWGRGKKEKKLGRIERPKGRNDANGLLYLGNGSASGGVGGVGKTQKEPSRGQNRETQWV